MYEMLSTPMLCSSVHWGFGKRMDQNDLLGDICNRLLLYTVRTMNAVVYCTYYECSMPFENRFLMSDCD